MHCKKRTLPGELAHTWFKPDEHRRGLTEGGKLGKDKNIFRRTRIVDRSPEEVNRAKKRNSRNLNMSTRRPASSRHCCLTLAGIVMLGSPRPHAKLPNLTVITLEKVQMSVTPKSSMSGPPSPYQNLHHDEIVYFLQN